MLGRLAALEAAGATVAHLVEPCRWEIWASRCDDVHIAAGNDPLALSAHLLEAIGLPLI